MFENNNQNFNNNNFNGNLVMNNNQNFNNTDYNSNQTFDNNNQNMNNYNYPGSIPNYGSNQNMMGSFPNQVVPEQNLDVPPVLDPIKPLSSTNDNLAPSMDALNPMNIMPKNLPNEQLNQVQISENNEDEDDSTDASGGNYNPIFNNQMDTSNFGANFSINNNYNVLPTGSINNISPQPQQINEYNKNLNIPPVSEQQVTNFFESQSLTDGYNVTNDIPYNSSFDNQPSTKMSSNYENNVPIQPDMKTSTNNTSLESVEPAFNQSLKNEQFINQESINVNPVNDNEPLSQDLMPNEETTNRLDNNVEISDIKLSEEKQEEDSDYLGLDSSYTEPDMLEIMDLESTDDNSEKIDIEAKEELDTENIESLSNSTLTIEESIEKIKNLIKEIKNTGVNIKLEEFDFEEMYQLVVKIDK